jgi:hypothetical protein
MSVQALNWRPTLPQDPSVFWTRHVDFYFSFDTATVSALRCSRAKTVHR